MAQQIKALSTKPEDLTLSPSTYKQGLVLSLHRVMQGLNSNCQVSTASTFISLALKSIILKLECCLEIKLNLKIKHNMNLLKDLARYGDTHLSSQHHGGGGTMNARPSLST